VLYKEGKQKFPFSLLLGEKGDTSCRVLNSLNPHHNCPGRTRHVPPAVRGRHQEEEQLQGEPVGQGGTHSAIPYVAAVGSRAFLLLHVLPSNPPL